MKYKVYQIEISPELIYYGRTNDSERRLKEHIYHCNNPKSKQHNKQLYIEIRNIHKDDESALNCLKSGFKVIFEYKNKADSKRKEIYLILDRYFNNKKLIQSIPKISDR